MKNLVIRSISGVFFIGIMLTSISYPKAYLVIFSSVILIMMIEYFQMALGKGFWLAKSLSMLTALLVFSLSFLAYAGYIHPKYILVSIAPLFSLFVSIIYDKKNFDKLIHIIFPILYIGIPFSIINLIVFPDFVFSGFPLMCLFLILWASDVGAYIFGMAFGQKYGKKLFPSISPKKSWIGYWGSLFTSILVGLLLSYYQLLEIGILHGIIISIIINVLGTFGDLFESLLKRNFGAKDSGKIMPGHGGLLDRFDGALMAFPIVVLYFILFGLT